MIGRATQVFNVAGIEPFGQVARDIAGTVVGQEARSIGRLGRVQAAGLQRQVEGGSDILGLHGGAQLPGDDVSGEVIEHGRQVEPAPTDHLEIGEVGLPQLVGCGGLGVELVGRLDDDKSRAGDQVMSCSQIF